MASFSRPGGFRQVWRKYFVMNVKNVTLISTMLVLAIAMVVFFVLFQNSSINTVVPIVKEQKGIQVFSPKENEVIFSPLKITGVVNGDGWSGFEGQVGTVSLQDSQGHQLARSILTATTEWTVLPTNFETNLQFTVSAIGTGFLVFHNENPSGDPARDKTLAIPILFKK